MTVSAAGTSVTPGGTILFWISAWADSTEGGTITATLTPSAQTPVFSPPVFTAGSCTCHAGSTSYNLTLPAHQPSAGQIGAQVKVPSTAPAGETIQFSATVSVADHSGAPLTATASAPTVTVAGAPASPSPTPSTKSGTSGSASSSSGGSTTGGSAAGGLTAGGSAAGGSTTGGLTAGGSAAGGLTAGGLGVALPSDAGAVALPIGTLPTIGSGTTGRTINVPAGSAANLFPQISPSSAPSSAPKTGGSAGQGRDAVVTSSVIPISLTGSQIGSQILGLIVLLLGIAIVVTGISMRKVRGIGKPSEAHS